jgi:hypothetical protein
MSVIAVITDPAQIRKMIACLERHGGARLPLGGALRLRWDEQAARHTSILTGVNHHGSNTSTPARSRFVSVQRATPRG